LCFITNLLDNDTRIDPYIRIIGDIDENTYISRIISINDAGNITTSKGDSNKKVKIKNLPLSEIDIKIILKYLRSRDVLKQFIMTHFYGSNAQTIAKNISKSDNIPYASRYVVYCAMGILYDILSEKIRSCIKLVEIIKSSIKEGVCNSQFKLPSKEVKYEYFDTRKLHLKF